MFPPGRERIQIYRITVPPIKLYTQSLNSPLSTDSFSVNLIYHRPQLKDLESKEMKQVSDFKFKIT